MQVASLVFLINSSVQNYAVALWSVVYLIT